MGFWRRPQTVLVRRVVFQLHVWAGVLTGVYALFIGLTGALLVFRPELQARAYPQYFDPLPADARLVDPQVVLANLSSTFPGYRFSGIDYPTYRRGTFLAYLSKGDELKTVFADAVSGRVLGELPRDGWIQRLQDLHFNFDAGQTGYVVNGIGASCLLVMCVTGLVIWWPGVEKAGQAFVVHVGRGWKRVVWELHGAVGIWTMALLVSWSLSGIYFSFPGPFRNVVASVTRLTNFRTPQSRPPSEPGALRDTLPGPLRGTRPTSLTPATLIAQARALVPGAQLARFVVPFGPTGSYAVVLARGVHGDWDASDEVTVYFDQYSGAHLRTDDRSRLTAGDGFMRWLGLLHVGSFGGVVVKVMWFAAGLAFPLLWVTGLVMWWNRFVRPATATRQGSALKTT